MNVKLTCIYFLKFKIFRARIFSTKKKKLMSELLFGKNKQSEEKRESIDNSNGIKSEKEA